MVGQRRGFALYEVVLGLVLLGALGSAAVRSALALGASVTEGRQWSRMAEAAAAQLAELERAFRVGAPACVAPPAGSAGRMGVRLDWRVADSPPLVRVTVVARSRVGGRFLVDSLRTSFACR